MTAPERAVDAAARAHYAYTWSNVNGAPEEAKARWDRGEVGDDVMEYHRDHVRPLVQAAEPTIAAQALRDAAEVVRERLVHQIPEDVALDTYEEGFRHGLNQGVHASTVLDAKARERDPQ